MLILVALITLPVEALVWPALRTPNVDDAAQEWVTSLSTAERTAFVSDIRTVPYEIRRQLMASYSPEQRAEVWDNNFQNYLNEHPELNAAQVAIITHTMAMIDADMFSGDPVTEDVHNQLIAVYTNAVSWLGPHAARELFYRLGPDRVDGTNVLPLHVRLTDRIRRYFVVEAAGAAACECSQGGDVDCAVGHTYCAEVSDCEITTDFPMCGPLWCSACTGLCRWYDSSK